VARITALTDTAIRNAKPKDKPFKLGDSGSLFLLAQPSGGKLWRMKFRVDGCEKKLAIRVHQRKNVPLFVPCQSESGPFRI